MTDTVLEVLAWFFDQEDSWPWVLGYSEYGIVNAVRVGEFENVMPLFESRHIYVTLESGKLISVVDFYNWPRDRTVPYEAVEVDKSTSKLLGEPCYYDTAGIFALFACG